MVGALIRITAHVLLLQLRAMSNTCSIPQSQPSRHSEGPGPSREQISLPQHPLSPVLKSILSELQGLKAEMKKMKTEQGKLKDAIEESTVKQFNIESSPYKVAI